MSNALVDVHTQFVAGNQALVLELVENGTVNANVRDIRGNTLLHKALGNSNATRRLIVAGADPNARNNFGNAPLHLAGPYWGVEATGSQGSIAQLLEAGADVNAPGEDDRTPLHAAVRHNNIEMMRHLLNNGANPNARDRSGQTPIFCAYRSVDAAKLLVESGADVNACDNHGQTVLLANVRWRGAGVATLRLLIDAGADVNAIAVLGGKTALHQSNFYGGTSIMKLLIERGADVNAIGDGVTPLHMAAQSGAAERTNLLLKAGADPHALDSRGKSAMHHVMRSHHFLCVMRLLFKAHVDVNVTDNDGMAPMHELFALSKNLDNRSVFAKAEMLIEHGAHIDTLNKHGNTPLFMRFAAELIDNYWTNPPDFVRNLRDDRRRELWPFFVERGARLDIAAPVMQYGVTNMEIVGQFGALTFAHFAVYFNDAELLKTAIAHGSDVNVRSMAFGSALHMACNRNNSALARILYENGAHDDIVSLMLLADVNSCFFAHFVKGNFLK